VRGELLVSDEVGVLEFYFIFGGEVGLETYKVVEEEAVVENLRATRA
jgi:hypothetical protein